MPLKFYQIEVISSRAAEAVEGNDQDRLAAMIPTTLTQSNRRDQFYGEKSMQQTHRISQK